ncbi:MAG: molybdopterin-dependent oxidoreductase [Gammaproteobacteria bacterium]|nr:molybdopterin-dependent oxidoreductase [Gammaproteobacteria bacterium]
MSEQAQAVETLKNVVCTSCDGFCPVAAKVRDGRVVKVTTREHPFFKDVICMKGAYAPKSFAHPERLMHPLKRVGARGDGNWQQVSWDDAMDDIADRLTKVVDQYGPESLAVASSVANYGNDNGLSRRFMNLLGTPNFISGVAYCMGNTAAVNRMVYGWYPRGDVLNSQCIVLFGHDPRRHSWTLEYKSIRMAQANGAKLIVLDPRKSQNAEVADVWLPLRAGTDAAMTLGWLNVIIEEGLYDKDFVRDWTVGFDAFAQRVRQYPLSRVAEITGVDAELIAKAARMYAEATPACIPWSPITDQQVSSTSAIRLQCALRALTGNIDVKGGEMFVGFNPGVRSDSEIELHGELSDAQKAKQLGAEEFPVFTYRGMEALGDATERVWGNRWANLVGGCYMANPMAVFKAMADSDPYPVRAFISLANNTLMSFANTKRIYDGLMKQDLIVTYEHMMTPTAQLSDYVLPGDSWLERSCIMAGVSAKAMEPPGECKGGTYFWHELAKRMGLGEHFPWATDEAMLDYRVEPGGTDWEAVVETGRLPKAGYEERKYLKTGFATPSGKVELDSSVLSDLGFDSLPYYREAATPTDEFPMSMFIGLPDDEYYRTGHRHIPELRQRAQDPTLYLSNADAKAMQFADGAWARITTSTGSMVGRVVARDSMPNGLIRVPHGWWKPESAAGLENMSGMWSFTDAQITPDEDPDLIDLEQGIPHMKGVPCRIEALADTEVQQLESTFGATAGLPLGPEGRVQKSKHRPDDFMYDDVSGDGVEFEAVALSLYGRNSL